MEKRKQKVSKELVEEIKEIVDPTIKLRHSDLRSLFREHKDKIKLLEEENERLREWVINLKKDVGDKQN